MCGIIGYTGTEDAASRIVDGLKALEYRGYDSAGLAVCAPDGVRVVKVAGKVSCLEEKVRAEGGCPAVCGIGHTRWATHGAPTAENAHPHRAPGVTLVHNGIIENENEWRKKLVAEGYRFSSETDTEVAAAVISRCLSQLGSPLAALRKARSLLTGSYAFVALFDGAPGVLYALRKQSPLLVAPADDGNYLASDLPAVLKHTRRWFPLEEDQTAVLRKDGITVYGADGLEVNPEIRTADWDRDAAEKGGWAHFMLKEIFEQPEALSRTILPRVREGLPYLESDGVSDALLRSVSQIRIVACGTAMHAGLMGKSVIESLARIPVSVEIASEFRYQDPILPDGTLVICCSQSGETADTMAALRLAKERGIPTVGIVNVKGSALSREADAVMYTHAGPEIAVASTKAYTVQVAVFSLLALRLAYLNGTVPETEIRDLTAVLAHDVPEKVKEALNAREFCREAAKLLADRHDVFYLGRGADYALALEGSLKLKEISYLHSEAYAGGELKHGTISLVVPGTPVIVIASDPALYGKTMSNLRETVTRGARAVLLHAPENEPDPAAEFRALLPGLPPVFACFGGAVLLQLIAYETAVLRGCDVDQPRNLAKSVTVE